MVCIDSDILIEFLRNNSQIVSKINRLKNSGENLAITSINSFELFKGISAISGMPKEKIAEFISNFSLYNFDYDSSRKAAEIFNDLKKNGDIIELPDIMIASIALTNNESIFTNNKKHFERIKELNLI